MLKTPIYTFGSSLTSLFLSITRSGGLTLRLHSLRYEHFPLLWFQACALSWQSRVCVFLITLWCLIWTTLLDHNSAAVSLLIVWHPVFSAWGVFAFSLWLWLGKSSIAAALSPQKEKRTTFWEFNLVRSVVFLSSVLRWWRQRLISLLWWRRALLWLFIARKAYRVAVEQEKRNRKSSAWQTMG